MSAEDEQDTLLGHVESRMFQAITAKPRISTRTSFLHLAVVLQAVVILVLSAFLLRPSATPSSVGAFSPACGQLSYSPAQDHIVYELRKFNDVMNISDSVYSDAPSDEVDQAWAELYNNIGLSQVSREEASQIEGLDENIVVPETSESPKYAVTLSVFHQLHCLNMLRKYIHADYYTDPAADFGRESKPEVRLLHIGHCFDMLRQGVMCAGDISPIVWAWNEQKGRVAAMMAITHSCRSWDKIVSWAEEHKLNQGPDEL